MPATPPSRDESPALRTRSRPPPTSPSRPHLLPLHQMTFVQIEPCSSKLVLVRWAARVSGAHNPCSERCLPPIRRIYRSRWRPIELPLVVARLSRRQMLCRGRPELRSAGAQTGKLDGCISYQQALGIPFALWQTVAVEPTTPFLPSDEFYWVAVPQGAIRIARHPATVNEYALFFAADPSAEPPSFWNDQLGFPAGPVVNVTWAGAAAYSGWMGSVRRNS